MEGICLMCYAGTDGAPLCGPECRREALGRRAANAALLRRLTASRKSSRLRYQLAQENGQLTSALMRYDTRT